MSYYDNGVGDLPGNKCGVNSTQPSDWNKQSLCWLAPAWIAPRLQITGEIAWFFSLLIMKT